MKLDEKIKKNDYIAIKNLSTKKMKMKYQYIAEHIWFLTRFLGV